MFSAKITSYTIKEECATEDGCDANLSGEHDDSALLREIFNILATESEGADEAAEGGELSVVEYTINPAYNSEEAARGLIAFIGNEMVPMLDDDHDIS